LTETNEKYIQSTESGRYAVVFPESIKTPRRHGTYDTMADAITARDAYLAGLDSAEDDHNDYPIIEAAGSRIVGLYDLHCPYQDDHAVSVAKKIVDIVQPDTVIFGGDVVDFYKLSRFLQDESRASDIQSELDTWYKTAQFLLDGTDAKVYNIVGNHELRLYRYLCANPELSSLDALKLENLLRLDDLRSTLCRAVSFLDRRLVWIHGRYWSKNAGSAVKREIDKRAYQQSIIQGHGHTMGHFDKSGPLYDIVGIEAGCLCQDSWYGEDGYWQRGVVVCTIANNKPEIENVKIDQVTIFRGNVIR